MTYILNILEVYVWDEIGYECKDVKLHLNNFLTHPYSFSHQLGMIVVSEPEKSAPNPLR